MAELQLPIDDIRFAVIDVESNGGITGDHRLIEIAMIVVQRNVTVHRYNSLADPNTRIPPFIEKMTGISEKMLKGAPKEGEALAPVFEELSNPNTVFVAHNAGFDWGFIKRGAERNRRTVPKTTQLCTVKLSRQLNPGLEKHNLGAVAEHMGIEIEDRHRAMGDAEATAIALKSMIEAARSEHSAAVLADLLVLQYVPGSPRALEALGMPVPRKRERRYGR